MVHKPVHLVRVCSKISPYPLTPLTPLSHDSGFGLPSKQAALLPGSGMYGGKGLCRRPPSFKEIELCGVCSFHVIFFVPFISCGVLNKYISLHIDDTPSANPREYCPLDQSLADSQERGAKAFQLNSPPPLLVCHIWPGPASFVRKHSRAFIKSFPLL